MNLDSKYLVQRVQITENSWLDIITPPEEIITSIPFDAMWEQHPDEHGKGMLYGKMTVFPRYYQAYESTYHFSGTDNEAISLPTEIKDLKNWVNNIGYGTFQQTLVNWYANGHDYIGSHADKEKEIIPYSPIVSVSLGATRLFRIRDKKNKKILLDIDLEHGSIVAMCGAFQKELKHEVVKVNGKKGLKVGPRMNITFRQFKPIQ